MFTSIEAAIVRTNVQQHQYQTARQVTKQLAAAGRVSYQQADKHNGGTAHLLIDGEQVGQASVLTPGWEYSERLMIIGWN